MTEIKKNVYLTLHKNFVRTDIEYTDKVTGESKTFNQVTLPKGTTIDGIDVGCYQFSPLFVNESRFRARISATFQCSPTERFGLRKPFSTVRETRCSMTPASPSTTR